MSIIHASTEVQLEDYKGKGRYYNAAYELMNFINVYQPGSKDSDTFHSLNDPTYSGFKIFFHFSSKTGLLASEEFVNSGLAYFKRIGDYERYNLLKLFIYQLSRISSEAQWMFDEVEGISDLVNRPFAEVKVNHTINLKTKETIDFKMLSLVMLYRDIVFDQNRGVYVLPANLRRFSMSIFIYDIRAFDSTSALAVNNLRTRHTQDISELNHVLIDCGMCEITNESGADFFTSVSNNQTEASTNNIHINIKQCMLSNLFNNIATSEVINNFKYDTEDQSPSEKRENKWINMLKEKIANTDIYRAVNDQYDFLTSKDSWKTGIETLGENVMTAAISKLENKVAQVYLGNVFGFGISDLANFGRSGTFVNTNRDNDSRTTSLNQPEDKDDLGNVNN